uniref:Endoglucanase n=1 Tax=Saccoglossus kowalevskii TaxID=10224 RepID=A0ABM0GV89_SACKO|nr:PREDICTED: uncharacterized protein LOC100371930 [Saccoglossus kowalevskii]
MRLCFVSVFFAAFTLHETLQRENNNVDKTDKKTTPVCVNGILVDSSCECPAGFIGETCEDYDYKLVLEKSLLFYETQRSGCLPPMRKRCRKRKKGYRYQPNRIPYRDDSATGDVDNLGRDLTGGYYDAGDHVKVTATIAYSMTVIAWGLIHFMDAYISAGQYTYALDCIRWGTDYLLKVRTEDDLIVLVGDFTLDHEFWGRPEDMTMLRPACHASYNDDRPTSEAMLTSAALSAASIVFKEIGKVWRRLGKIYVILLMATDYTFTVYAILTSQKSFVSGGRYLKYDLLARHEYYVHNTRYSNNLLSKAKSVYEKFEETPGLFEGPCLDHYTFPRYTDKVVWAEAWYYKSSNNETFRSKAEAHYIQWGLENTLVPFAWNDVRAGTQLLMYNVTGEKEYAVDFKTYLNDWLPGHEVDYTPLGLAHGDNWAPLRMAANQAFLALLANNLGVGPKTYTEFAESQIGYMLGDTGRSFVTNFGVNPPVRPHHRSSSCPSEPDSCGWAFLTATEPNIQTLEGGLVGGPLIDDSYTDDRQDYRANEVAIDYNAGFQSAIADYDYKLVLEKSLLFYETQRSGYLPPANKNDRRKYQYENRIPYRDDSATGDVNNRGGDMTGGYYDDFQLFIHLCKRDAYISAAQYKYALDCIRWGTDYLLKVKNKNDLIVLLGDFTLDRQFWGRPEDMTMPRPACHASFRYDHPTAEAMLTSSALFSRYKDKVVWAEAWYYNSSNNDAFKGKAVVHYSQWRLDSSVEPFARNDVGAGAQLLMYDVTQENEYANNFKKYLNDWLPGRTVPYTPLGLAYYKELSPLILAEFAKSQIGYMLGDTGRSFTNFGVNPPLRPHHRSRLIFCGKHKTVKPLAFI